MRNNHMAQGHQQKPVKNKLASEKEHVPRRRLEQLTEGFSLSIDNQEVFGPARDQDYTSAAQTESVTGINGEELFPGPLKHPLKTPSRIHYRSMTSSSLPSPPTKQTKGESTVSRKPAISTAPATGGWGNFTTHIVQDDKSMVVKAREELKRLGGQTFRPEFREIYKDQKGKKEITVHHKTGGSTDPGIAAEPQDNTTVKEKQREAQKEEASGEAVVVDCAYDTDSSGGGVALSPSDLETDSWVGIKTEDEHASWKQD